MFDIEGISKCASEGLHRSGLSDSAKEYFNEVIPSDEDWNNMSDVEKSDCWNCIELRLEEVADLTNVNEAEVAKNIPQYIFDSMREQAGNIEVPYCDEGEFSDRKDWAVKEFNERDALRDVSYSEANMEQRAEYMIDFYQNFSEFSGYNAELVFVDMEPGDMGAYSSDTNTISLNKNLLEDSNPEELMKTIMHETRHAYQQYAVDFPDKVSVDEATILEWKENFDYYIRPEWDFEAYVSQPVEADADLFAESAYNGIYC